METPVQQRALRRFLLGILALVLLLVAGTAGYRWLEGMSIVDAMYMAVITLSTVGFTEVHPLSPAGRVFTMGLILGGAGLAAYTLSSVAEFALSGDWRAYVREQRRQRMLAQLSQHIIVCGYGRLGRQVVQGLKTEGLPFVVLDPNHDKIARLRAAGELALHGNAAHETNLKVAGIERARGLVAAANGDAENVFIVLTARGLRQDLLILARADYEESEAKLVRAGADRVILPYSITGRRMVTLVARPAVADFLEEVTHSRGLELLLEEVQFQPGSPVVGQTVAQVHELAARLGVTLLAYQSPGGRMEVRPRPDTMVQVGAHLVVLGTGEQLQALNLLAEGSRTGSG